MLCDDLEGWGRGLAGREAQEGEDICVLTADSQVALVVRNSPANAGDIRDTGSIPGLGRSPGGGNGNPLQYSCLEKPMNREAWQATAHWARKELDTTEAT